MAIGFKDLCEIGDGSRPKLFDLNIRKPKVLFDQVIEIEERVTIEDYELNPFPQPEFDETDPALVKTSSGEIVRVLQPVDADVTRKQLRKLRDEGFTSVAVCFMHSHIYPGKHQPPIVTKSSFCNVIKDHEKTVGDIAREEGFDSISLSSEISPRIKMLQRATAVCTDAYLSPIVRTYVEDFMAGFEVPPQRVEFMSSDGGLRPAQKYTGNAALISGPAGGVVGVAKSCYDLKDPRALIGFDMVRLEL